mmetsp:Transcript_35625/g.87636  ORF Transcript_35625/g.87636 Transcript_35625/m.87636 type:complete len:290 (+) Transcript_35625:653-1522(+)
MASASSSVHRPAQLAPTTRVRPLDTPPPPNLTSTAGQLSRTQSHTTRRPARDLAAPPTMLPPSCLRTTSVMLNASAASTVSLSRAPPPMAPSSVDSSRLDSAAAYSALSVANSSAPPWRSAEANTAPLRSAGTALRSPARYASKRRRASATVAGCSNANARDTASCRRSDVWYASSAISPPAGSHPRRSTRGANRSAPNARSASTTSSGCSKNDDVNPPSPEAISDHTTYDVSLASEYAVRSSSAAVVEAYPAAPHANASEMSPTRSVSAMDGSDFMMAAREASSYTTR